MCGFSILSLYRLMQLCFWVAKPALLPTLHTLELLIALGKGVILLKAWRISII